jgi:hypothetical protein
MLSVWVCAPKENLALVIPFFRVLENDLRAPTPTPLLPGEKFASFRSLGLWDSRDRSEPQTVPQTLCLGFQAGGRMQLVTQGQNQL